MTGSRARVFAERYRVIRRLGAGSTAAVFLAHDERLGREVAVKRIHGAEVTGDTAQRLRREARIMASLRHPNLVAVYDMLMDEDDLLLVMEYVGGQTLADVLASAPLAWERVRELLEPVAAALDYVHGEGVVHRDLKPSNILVGASGVVKVADLGLATAAEITKITPPGAILGTPAYMAPEQGRADPCTTAVDIYALASIAFQALSGTLPRAGTTVVAILAQAVRQPPPDLRERRPGTPAAAAAALVRGMAAKPEDRQRLASQLLAELDSAFAADGGEAAAARNGDRSPEPAGPRRPMPVPHPRRTRRRPANRRARVLAPAALLVGLAVAVIAVLTAGGDRARPPAPPRTASRPAAAASAEPVATATVTPTAAAPRRLSPAATVRAFYDRAAAGDYAAAWRLAGPAMRSAFGDSLARFRGDLSSLRHVEFRQLAITGRDASGVTVQVETVATHANRVDHCSGTLRTVRGASGRWLVEPSGLRCTTLR